MRGTLGSIAVLTYLSLVMAPVALALHRIISVTGFTPGGWIQSLSENYISAGVLEFTLVQAACSTILTSMVALPVAWVLGRYRWPFEHWIRAVLTLPFVIPSIIAAMGVLTLVGVHGANIRANEATWWWTLIASHAWFNMALYIRFCEPLLSTMDPRLEEQLRLLPNGRSRLSRVRNLWAPLLMPSMAAAACMTFVFSFTSFALVRWITIRDDTLESMMAEVSSSAGISGYMETSSQIVMGASMIQFTILLLCLWLTSAIQRNRQARLRLSSPRRLNSPSWPAWLVLVPAMVFAISPLASVVVGSFRIRDPTIGNSDFRWGLDGWEAAIHGSFSFPPMSNAISNSLGYALVALLVALPLGYLLAATIHRLERTKPLLSRALDISTMLPFALSAAMVGLGVLIGVIRLNPQSLYQFWPLPSLAHVMLTTPFVVRIILPALRSYDKRYEENAMVLGMGAYARFLKIKLPLMRGPLVVSSVFVIAMSLGEFGASFIIARNSDWVTMPLLIDAWRAKPMKDPLSAPASNSIATVLMLITMGLFLLAERFRSDRQGGMF